jgi:hypothetical protein
LDIATHISLACHFRVHFGVHTNRGGADCEGNMLDGKTVANSKPVVVVVHRNVCVWALIDRHIIQQTHSRTLRENAYMMMMMVSLKKRDDAKS